MIVRPNQGYSKIGLFVLLFALAVCVVDSWCACYQGYTTNTCLFGQNANCSSSCRYQSGVPSNLQWCDYYVGGSASCYESETKCYASVKYCDTKCELDSLKNYSSCIAQGNRWENCECVENTSADSSFIMCNDYVYNGNVTYKAYKLTMHYENHVLTSVCGASTSVAGGSGYESICPVIRSGSGSCTQAGIPPTTPPQDCGSSPNCDEAEDPLPSAECYAVLGSKCYFRDVSTRNTYSCECDGSCQFGYTQMWTGQACHNPYNNPPSSSDSGSGGSSDSGSGGSSDSGSGGSSDSGSGSDKDYTNQLNQIIANTQDIANNTSDISQWTQTTMDNTTDIKNILEGDIAIDVNHIRNATENIDATTQSIDTKLNTTNGLLNDIKNKDFLPNIHFNPNINVEVAGDTNIINVGGDTIIVNADTVKAPFEILEFLKGLFGGMDTTANYDTTGWGRVNDSAKFQLDSALQKGDWVTSLGCDTTGGRKCDESIIGAHGLDSAKSSLKATFAQLGDTLKNGAFGDSLANWSSKFTAGAINGSGSDNCPSVLSRNYHIELVQGAGFDLTLGRFLCQPLVGNTTGWALCRLLLRAGVALACMWFLFHCATGFGGRGGDDD